MSLLTPTLLRTGLRDLRRRPMHTGLMVLGVALGTAVVVAIDLANESARRAFERSAQAVAGRATHVIAGGPSGVSEELFARLRTDLGQRRSAPVVEGDVVAVDQERQPLRVLGVDPWAEAAFRDQLGGDRAKSAVSRLLTVRNGVVVGAPWAARYGLGPGRTLRLRVGDRFEEARVVGVVHPADPGSRALDGLLVMDVGMAQKLLRTEGRLSRIDLILSPAEAEALARHLPAEVRLQPAAEEAATLGQLSAAFELNLKALSLLALVVGMFLVYNTVTWSVVQRRAVLATLRSLGATGSQVFALVLAEAALAALAGASIGLGLGYVLAQAAVTAVTRTINDFYYLVTVTGAPLTLPAAAKAIALGVGAGLAAAIPPAVEAARVEPVTALRPSTLLASTRLLVPRLSVVGIVLAACGALLLGGARSLPATFAGLFGVLLGLALLAPAATTVLMAVASPLAARFGGTLGRLAVRTVSRSIPRTGVAVAALMVAVSVTVGVSLMIGSFRATVVHWLDLSLRADVYIGPPGTPGASRIPVLSPDVPARVAAVAGVAEVETLRAVNVRSPEGDVRLNVADPRRERDAGLYRFAEGTPAQTWQKVEEGAVLVSEPFAYRRSLPPRGARVTLLTDHGPRVFPVAGVFYDYSTERGTMLMARPVYERHWDDRAITSMAVYVAPGETAEGVTDRLRTALSGTALRVTANRALRTEALRVFDRTFAVTEALRLLAVGVAFVGVWSALLALQTERQRELATLVALGLTPGELVRLTAVETGLIGLAAGLLSMPTGALLAFILVEVINLRSFGWTMQLRFEPMVFGQALVTSVGAALLACLYPSWRLGRLPVAAALRQE